MSNMDIENLQAYLPQSIITFLSTVFPKNVNPLKTAVIGHEMAQPSRPRALLSPLHLSLAVELHNHYASRFLIDTLNHLGFCSSYAELQMYQRSVTVVVGTDVELSTTRHSIQYVMDVDHNTRTKDGRNTFHGMGIIAAVTPAIHRRIAVPRVQVKNDDIKFCTIDIKNSPQLEDNLRKLHYTEIPIMPSVDRFSHLDTLWRAFGKCGFSGMMQMVTNGEYPGKSSLIFYTDD